MDTAIEKPDPSRWLNKDSRTFLSRDYLREDQTAEGRIREVAESAAALLNKPEFADKFEDYMLRGWISLASPVWSNFGQPNRGLPISCNGSYIGDSISEIMRKNAEIGMMSKFGAGTSAYLGDIRGRGSLISTGGKANGPAYFAEIIQTTVNVVSQGNIRRGSCAIYLPVEHPDIKEWLNFHEEGSDIQKLSFAVTITDEWMESMLAGDVAKRKIWTRIIQKRFESGYPYITFIDNVNRGRPKWYKDQDIKIVAQNLCNEIALPSSKDESFVCCLSSLNLLYWDEWKNTDLVETVTYFLDAVMEEYIRKLKADPGKYAFMEDALRFAERHRAVGLGILGWHSLLQSRMLPFESVEAKRLNVEIWKAISERSYAASRQMAVEYGEPEVLKGYGMRNATTMAMAPTTSSSAILGQVSPSGEPENSNYFVKDLAKGKFTKKNPFLKALLKEKGKDTKEVWEDILSHGGSVQHLDFLDENEKAVFKTFGEIPQIEIITQASQRQEYIDQGQSINLTIHPDAPPKDVSLLTIEAWKLGLKGLYYQRSTNKAQDFARSLLTCVACEA